MKHTFSLKTVACLLLAMTLFSNCCKDDDIKTVNKHASSEQQNRTPNDDNTPAAPSDTTTANEQTGTIDAPFLIASNTDWDKWMNMHATEPSLHYRLTDNISLHSTVDTFCGILDGNEHSITISNHAIFKILSGATVKNLIIEGSVQSLTVNDLFLQYNKANVPERYFGCLACMAQKNTLMENCRSKVEFKLTSEYFCFASPLCGWTRQSEINRCCYLGKMSVTTGRMGGITVCLDTGSFIRNCYCLAEFQGGEDMEMGGIAFVVNQSKLINSYVFGSMAGSGQANVAGIAIRCKGGLIDNCYYAGTLTGFDPSAVCQAISANGMVRYCYGELSNDAQLISHKNGGYEEYCIALTNAITLSKAGYYGSLLLLDELNARAVTLENADRWTMTDGRVALSE